MTKFWTSDENFYRRKFSPTKIFTDEVFASKVFATDDDDRRQIHLRSNTHGCELINKFKNSHPNIDADSDYINAELECFSIIATCLYI